jgi:hypothetical protein
VRMVKHGWPMVFETLKLRKRLRQTACEPQPIAVTAQPAPLAK